MFPFKNCRSAVQSRTNSDAGSLEPNILHGCKAQNITSFSQSRDDATVHFNVALETFLVTAVVPLLQLAQPEVQRMRSGLFLSYSAQLHHMPLRTHVPFASQTGCGHTAVRPLCPSQCNQQVRSGSQMSPQAQRIWYQWAVEGFCIQGMQHIGGMRELSHMCCHWSLLPGFPEIMNEGWQARRSAGVQLRLTCWGPLFSGKIINIMSSKAT